MADKETDKEGSGESSSPAPAAAPVFGAAFTFGVPPGASGFTAAGTTFAGFGAKAGAFAAPAAAARALFRQLTCRPADDDEGEDAGGDPEAECTATFKPLVTLEEVAVTTGEENEEILFEAKAKNYRFETEWKEKGTGVLKLLQHKETRKVRLLMRRDKTLKICANFLVLPSCKLSEHSGSDKSCVFTTQDFSEESSGKQEMFCLRFGSVEKVKAFWAAWEAAQATNAGLGVGTGAGAAADEPRDKPAVSEASEKTQSVAGGAEEEGEEVSSKAADALADTLAGGAKI